MLWQNCSVLQFWGSMRAVWAIQTLCQRQQFQSKWLEKPVIKEICPLLGLIFCARFTVGRAWRAFKEAENTLVVHTGWCYEYFWCALALATINLVEVADRLCIRIIGLRRLNTGFLT